MAKIYLPLEEGEHYACYVVYDKDTVRAYIQTPSYNTITGYRDYFINSHYLYKDGNTTWGNYSTLPTCLSSDIITNDYWYRNDISDILISFMIISILVLYLPYKIISRGFGRWLKI